jgi:dTDP-4-dehydrorhamnose 3,5-epimerase
MAAGSLVLVARQFCDGARRFGLLSARHASVESAGEPVPVSTPVNLLKLKRFTDERGWFTETYNERQFLAAGIATRFVQDNHSLSRRVGVLRGLHFQTPPHGQAKLVRCVRGRIFDVVVDVRRGSPTYGRWVGAELSAENGEQLLVPIGFAHGFLTLEPDTEVIYKVSDFYAPECDGGIRWNDSTIAVAWPLAEGARPQLSAKDEALPLLADFDSPFAYDGNPLAPLDKPLS